MGRDALVGGIDTMGVVGRVIQRTGRFIMRDINEGSRLCTAVVKIILDGNVMSGIRTSALC